MSSAEDPDLLDPQHLGLFDPDPQKYKDPRIRIKGPKYPTKAAKKNVGSQNSNLNCLKNVLISSWFIKF